MRLGIGIRTEHASFLYLNLSVITSLHNFVSPRVSRVTAVFCPNLFFMRQCRFPSRIIFFSKNVHPLVGFLVKTLVSLPIAYTHSQTPPTPPHPDECNELPIHLSALPDKKSFTKNSRHLVTHYWQLTRWRERWLGCPALVGMRMDEHWTFVNLKIESIWSIRIDMLLDILERFYLTVCKLSEYLQQYWRKNLL